MLMGGTLKIADFGLSRTGGLIGTPAYAAPEQAAGQQAGPAADVYALGAVLYEMLTGRPPFSGANAHEVLLAVRGRSPAAPRQLRREVPRDLETVCLKCLEKEPQRRYGSAAELADDLGRFLAGDPIRARPLTPLARALRDLRRRPLLVLAALMGLAALVAGLWLWLRR
jgi:serine/threonine-protein kinase